MGLLVFDSPLLMQDRFAKYHPLVNFLYFTLVIDFSMALNHPLSQGISLVCACVYAVQADGKKAVLFTLKWCLPIMLLTAFMNPAAATVIFILIAAESMLEKLDRIKVKYGLVE